MLGEIKRANALAGLSASDRKLWFQSESEVDRMESIGNLKRRQKELLQLGSTEALKVGKNASGVEVSAADARHFFGGIQGFDKTGQGIGNISMREGLKLLEQGQMTLQDMYGKNNWSQGGVRRDQEMQGWQARESAMDVGDQIDPKWWQKFILWSAGYSADVDKVRLEKDFGLNDVKGNLY